MRRERRQPRGTKPGRRQPAKSRPFQWTGSPLDWPGQMRAMCPRFALWTVEFAYLPEDEAMNRIRLLTLALAAAVIPAVSHAQDTTKRDTTKKESTAAKVGRQTGQS